jgi:hypothetical protein
MTESERPSTVVQGLIPVGLFLCLEKQGLKGPHLRPGKEGIGRKRWQDIIPTSLCEIS